MKIKKLPEEAISKLQSGLIITDAVQCVLELVHNSLDAGATGVAVRIDLKNHKVRVIDNGKGIRRDDFELVGEKFMTSKYHSRDMNPTFHTYGFRGQALSSLIDTCKLLTIETKSENDGPTFVKVFQNKKGSAIHEETSEREGTGTTVTVEDFMCSMPVRRKRINEVFDIEEIKNQLQYLALIHYNVCFTLRNENKGVILLQTPQASNTLEAVSNIFGKTVAKSLKALYFKEKKCEISGLLSLKPQVQSKIQLLYINKRIVTKGLTHKFINTAMKEYVGKNILSNVLKEDSPAHQAFKQLKNSCHNIFIIQIQCPSSECEIITNMRKTTVEFRNWKEILKNLHKAIKRTFKEVLNLDSSSNIQENGSDYNKIVKTKRKFGTSVLMNAVKGDPVKRKLISKKNPKQKKKVLNEVLSDLSGLELKSKRKLLNQSNSCCKEISNESNDSLESPIPKKRYKRSESNFKIKSNEALNQSFFEFYEWVKAKVETDKNAFNLYNDFLQFKNEVKRSTHRSNAEFNSPVVGGKPKRKKIAGPERAKKNQKSKQKEPESLSAMNEKIQDMAREQLKIFPSSRLRMKKEVQFTAEKNANILENLNFKYVGIEDAALFKEPFNLHSLNKLPCQLEFNQTVPSLPSSEVQLNNVIKFRNWSESFFQQQSADIYAEIPQDYTFTSVCDTWVSHYQDSESKNLEFKRPEPKTVAISLRGNNKIRKRKNAENFLFQKAWANECSYKFTNPKGSKPFHDVQIQVNMRRAKSRKENAIVQTSLTDSIIPNTFNFKGHEEIRKAPEINMEVKPAEEAGLKNLSHGVPNPDFWNTSAHSCQRENFDPEMGKIPSSSVMNEKNSTSSDFVCAQKTNSNAQPQNEASTSKETQTLAAIWADSLTEIINAATVADSNLKSGSTLPKTIPLEEIEIDLLKPVELGFSLTERHQFIPKGLSPKFLISDMSKTFSLSPSEKCRLKLTVDNARNDLLATVKWQDESTGDYIKPILPDGIIDEMRVKAEKSVLNFENPVLTASLSYCAVKVHNLLHSFAFTKELLSNVEVLGQLDKKFIVTKMKLSAPKKMELISLFDQHAVDERIKLEQLIRDYTSSDGKFIASRLNPSVKCTLNESDVRIISDSNEKLLSFGLDVKVINEKTVSVNGIPTFLLDKHAKDLKNRKEVSLTDVLQTLIISIVDEMSETRGALPKTPRVMHNALCLEACHKAIKFNRALSTQKMSEMINKLKFCSLPFQCAHGRPSVIPIIDLEDFQSLMKDSEGFEVEKLKKFNCQLNMESPRENL